MWKYSSKSSDCITLKIDVLNLLTGNRITYIIMHASALEMMEYQLDS